MAKAMILVFNAHDPSEIILICWFGAQESFLIIILMLKTLVLLNIFVEIRVLWQIDT